MHERLSPDLPVAQVLNEAVAASRGGAAIVTAPPGSGKTMLVPAAVLDDLAAEQKLVLVQPRRLAARAVARHLAYLRGGEVGGEVGYHVRFDANVSRHTRLVVVTTGILLRKLLDDIALDGIGAVVLDEFHERSIEMDLALGMLARLRQTLRPDLRVIVMSATLAANPVAGLLGNCPIIHAEGRRFPVEMRYLARGERQPIEDHVSKQLPFALRDTNGHVLVFLPGVREILRCQRTIAPLAERAGHVVLPLCGDLSAQAQDAVLGETGHRKIILATNVAETSLTIEGVTAVIDSGEARQLHVSLATGLPRLELVPISQASAEQRAGRAGRTAPGVCWRLWTEASHRLRPSADLPEILRGDFAEPLLHLLAQGENTDFLWLDRPPPESVENATQLLELLGAIDSERRITPLGRSLAEIPAHPRLARLLLAGAERGVLRETSLAAAMLSERDPFRPAERSSNRPREYGGTRARSDVVERVAALQAFHAQGATVLGQLEVQPGAARNIVRAADQLYRLTDFPGGVRAPNIDQELMHALLEAFPDRLARLRSGTQDRAVLVGGRGVRIDASSHVRGEPLFLAIDIDDRGGEARTRLVSAVERAWLSDRFLSRRDELFFNPTQGRVEARQRTYWLDLLLDETPVAIADTNGAAELLAGQARRQFNQVRPASGSAAASFIDRVCWLRDAVPDLGLPRLDDEDLQSMLPKICYGLRSLEDVQKADWLTALLGIVGCDRLVEIDRLAPPHIELTNGNRHTIVYERGKSPVLAVRIQEMFGVAETPRIAGGRAPLLLHLLGPNYRPQQVTADLASFWRTGYPEVKKELRRRYPKHAWPDDPLATPATRSGLKRDAR